MKETWKMETDFFSNGEYDVPIVVCGLGQSQTLAAQESPRSLVKPQISGPHLQGP